MIFGVDILQIVLTIISSLIFLFLFWRRLKEDYVRNQIFTSGLFVLLGVAIGSVIADNFAPQMWFWLSLLGAASGIFSGIVKYDLRVFESLEAFVFAGFSLIAAPFLFDFLKSSEFASGIGFLVCVLMMFLYGLINKHYKRFTWYRSGKVGFTGLAVGGLFFLIRSLIALRFPDVLSFVGTNDAIASGILAFIAFLVVFNLSRQ